MHGRLRQGSVAPELGLIDELAHAQAGRAHQAAEVGLIGAVVGVILGYDANPDYS